MTNNKIYPKYEDAREGGKCNIIMIDDDCVKYECSNLVKDFSHVLELIEKNKFHLITDRNKNLVLAIHMKSLYDRFEEPIGFLYVYVDIDDDNNKRSINNIEFHIIHSSEDVDPLKKEIDINTIKTLNCKGIFSLLYSLMVESVGGYIDKSCNKLSHWEEYTYSSNYNKYEYKDETDYIYKNKLYTLNLNRLIDVNDYSNDLIDLYQFYTNPGSVGEDDTFYEILTLHYEDYRLELHLDSFEGSIFFRVYDSGLLLESKDSECEDISLRYLITTSLKELLYLLINIIIKYRDEN